MRLGADESSLKAYKQEKSKEPYPGQKLVGRTIYLMRELTAPKNFGAMYCVTGSAMQLDDGAVHRGGTQPDTYQALEVILDMPWKYGVVGCMVSFHSSKDRSLLIQSFPPEIWDAFEGDHLSAGQYPELETYRGRTHLAEMITLLRPPLPHRRKCVSDSGEPCIIQGVLLFA